MEYMTITGTVSEYEARKCEELTKRGFPKNELWLTELTSSRSFARFYGFATLFDLNPNGEPFVLYYHESGNIYGIGFFHDEEGFQKACDYLASQC
jgi:hypothetical protein